MYIRGLFIQYKMIKDLEKNGITFLVNTCDGYSDLWYPFFKLFKKYFPYNGEKIILNTETLNYEYEGLNIECVHPEKSSVPYGERIINAINHINTKYVFLLLDDFFIKEPVSIQKINKVIEWMESDKKIACFYNDLTPTWRDEEVDKYEGFKRIPLGNEYTLNLQAAVWRTKVLKKFWRKNVSPWEWEEVCNLTATENKKYKFYCLTSLDNMLCNYGHKDFGVVSGKWRAKEETIDFFNKENIEIDFSKRGFAKDSVPKKESKPKKGSKFSGFLANIHDQYKILRRCLPNYTVRFTMYIIANCLNGENKFSVYSFLNDRMNKIKKYVDKDAEKK